MADVRTPLDREGGIVFEGPGKTFSSDNALTNSFWNSGGGRGRGVEDCRVPVRAPQDHLPRCACFYSLP